MKLIKTDDQVFASINSNLRSGKDLARQGDKLVEAAKDQALSWLKRERGLDVESLPAGELVMVQLAGKDCLKIERKASRRLDQKRLQAERPEICAEFVSTNPSTYFDAVILG